MGTCISKFDCNCTKSSSSLLPQKQEQPQQLPQRPAAIQDKLVIHSSSPLCSTNQLADSSSPSIKQPPALLSPSLSATQSTTNITGNCNNSSSSISCTSSTLSNVSTSSSSSTTTTTSSDESFQSSTVKKQHSAKPRPTTQRQRKKPPPEPPKHPSNRGAPTNHTSSCPQQQKSLRRDQQLQHISRSTKTSTAPKRDNVVGINQMSKTRCNSESNCYVKTNNRPIGDRSNVRPSNDLNKRRKEMVKQKKTESRVHHALLADQIVDSKRSSSHSYGDKEDMDNSLVALDCFIFL